MEIVSACRFLKVFTILQFLQFLAICINSFDP
jgi:hypothetical protein